MSIPAHQQWPLAGRIGFRFLFAYLILQNLSFPLGYVPLTYVVGEWHLKANVALANWTQIHLFGIAHPVPFAFTGSGDTSQAYATQLDLMLLALLAAIIWTLIDRGRTNDSRLYGWLRVWVRMLLATIIFGYGFAKVIPSQFPPPSLERYVQPLGDLSPMGLLWTFMGSSTAYNVFSGLIEVLGGALLLFRRTATLGALLVMAAMANVAMLNFAYDVPVKIFSLNLMLMAAFIAAPDVRRLVNVLVLNRTAVARPMPPLLASRPATLAATAAWTLFIGYIVWSGVTGDLSSQRETAAGIAASPLYGIYDVEEFRRNGVALPPLLSDSMQWRRVIFGSDRRLTIRTMSDSVGRYTANADTATHVIALTGRGAPALPLSLGYERLDRDHAILRGHVGSDSIVARLRRVDESRFLLLNRGFHWIQEKPFNR